MLRCDKCSRLLVVIRAHRNKFYCDNCKAWLGWVAYSEESAEDIKYCIECNINHAKHSKRVI